MTSSGGASRVLTRAREASHGTGEREVEFGEGADVGRVDPGAGFFPRQREKLSALLRRLTQHEIRRSKDGRYLCRPMGGDGRRSDANALPWPLVPLDIDELSSSDLQKLEQWCRDSNLQGIAASTFSHRAEEPKARLWLVASRDVLAAEHAYVHKALSCMVPFKLDPCMVKPSQPVFFPACPPEREEDAFSFWFDGAPLDIDRLLSSYRADIEEEQRKREARASGEAETAGVRQPGGLIEFFNENYDLVELIEAHGYRRKTRNRYVAPGSKSKRAAVVLYDGKSLISFHEPDHDPLAARGKNGQARLHDAFSCFCVLEHSDDFRSAFKGALTWARKNGFSDSYTPSTKRKTASTSSLSLLPLRLFNPSELYTHLVPQDMLVDGILDRGSVVVAAGDSNSGKTTVLQLLALQIARGAPFGAHATKQGPVLWIAGEDMDNAKYRMVAMCEEYGISAPSIGDAFLLLPQPVAVLDEQSMASLAEAVEKRLGEGAEFALVVLDSKSVNWGGLDENSNDENASFVAAVREHLVARFGRPAVLITHHLTKQKEKESRSSRGASSLINNADHEWRFEMNQTARTCAMSPGSKVRLERWQEQKFLVKVVELDRKRFPHLANNFGHLPRVSIAEPVNAFNRSMRQVAADADLSLALRALAALQTSKAEDRGFTAVAETAGWVSSQSGKPDYRKAKRLLEEARRQGLADSAPHPKKGSKVLVFSVTEAGRRYAELAELSSSTTSREDEVDFSGAVADNRSEEGE